MRGRERAAAILLVAASAAGLAGCQRQLAALFLPKPTPAPVAAPSVTVGAVLPRPLDAKALAVLAFGKGKGEAAVPAWRPPKGWPGEDGPEIDEKTRFVCQAEGMVPFAHGDDVRAFVVTSARPEGHDCHPCAPLVGAIALTEGAAGWRVDTVDLEAGAWGANGEAPSFTVAEMGPGRAALVLEPGWMGQGIITSGLVVLAEQRDGRFAEVLTVGETDSENGGACGEEGDGSPCWAFSSTWKFVDEGGRDPRDLRIRTTGTRAASSGDGVEELDETKVYRFDGARYALLK